MADPAFRGFVESTLDALLVFEGCRRGTLSKITRRLQEFEKRELVQSGAVFVFDEKETGIKRWTDGLQWSPSRTLGNFLVYRELDRKIQRPDGEEVSARPVGSMAEKGPEPSAAFPFGGANGDPEALAAARRQRSLSDSSSGLLDRERERQLVGSLTSSYRFRSDGLVKKTISLSGLHLIGYYRIDDVTSGRLRTPSSLAEFTSFEIHPAFLSPNLFRVPPLVEIGLDGVLRYKGEQQENSPPGSMLPFSGGSSNHSRPASSDSGGSSRLTSPYLAPLSFGNPSSRERPPSSPRPSTGLRTTQRFDPYGNRTSPHSSSNPNFPILAQPLYSYSNSYPTRGGGEGRHIKLEERPNSALSQTSPIEGPNPSYYHQARYSMPFLPSQQSSGLSTSPGRGGGGGNTQFAYQAPLPPAGESISPWGPPRRNESFDGGGLGGFGGGMAHVRGTNYSNYVAGHSLPSTHSSYSLDNSYQKRPYTQPMPTPNSISHAPLSYGGGPSNFDPSHYREPPGPQPTSRHTEFPSSYQYPMSSHEHPSSYPSPDLYRQVPQPTVSPNPSTGSNFSMHSMHSDHSGHSLRPGAFEDSNPSPASMARGLPAHLGLVVEEPVGVTSRIPTQGEDESQGREMGSREVNPALRSGDRDGSYVAGGTMVPGEGGRDGGGDYPRPPTATRLGDSPNINTYYQDKLLAPHSPPQDRTLWWKDGGQAWQPAHVE